MEKYFYPTLRVFIHFLLSLFLMGCDLLPETLTDAISGASKQMYQDGNSLFHQTDIIVLKTGELEVTGEIKNPGKVDLDNHYMREVFIKESLYDNKTGIDFLGAYRYRGYSLFDLLHPFNQDKKNADEFRPAMDLYVVIENAKGESVTFSWSEIFHTNNPHQIIIAAEAAPIVPYRREVEYETGEYWRVVAANDLFAWRVLENPAKITVRSFDKKSYAINRDMDPLYSAGIDVVKNEEYIMRIEPVDDKSSFNRYHSSFYGMGMGYHEAEFFEGPLLKNMLHNSFNFFDRDWNRHGLVCFASVDGYRAIYSYSELFNRTDQVFPILAVPDNPEDGGFYRIFHPAEFYADRSVKSVMEMYFFKEHP